VTGGPTHVLYARALMAENANEQALYELDTALLTNMPPKDKANAHALMAQVYTALKRPADAQKHKDEAQKLDPGSTEAQPAKP